MNRDRLSHSLSLSFVKKWSFSFFVIFSFSLFYFFFLFLSFMKLKNKIERKNNLNFHIIGASHHRRNELTNNLFPVHVQLNLIEWFFFTNCNESEIVSNSKQLHHEIFYWKFFLFIMEFVINILLVFHKSFLSTNHELFQPATSFMWCKCFVAEGFHKYLRQMQLG